ncbi:putative PurR-regulated permease PerM [Parvibaculum indicum]|uniref:AI-2E family transporter n=1 Tax=Parvibaculum indicum TaxID=562969 RepID=UPI0014223927|nr:AI-2E family transporter [Parvibaculum indicum]NIJ43059.1 putative PurR-regulated permease PerM [Parvibaculum indicum]
MSIQRQLIVWAIVAFVFVLMLWLLESILLPFVAGMAIAYFLDPMADKLEEWGLSRLWATGVITIFFVIVMVVAAILILPPVVQQAVSLAESLPNLLEEARQGLLHLTSARLEAIFGERAADIQDAIKNSLGDSFGWLLNIIASVGSQGLQIAGVIALVVVTPVVAFYLLLDWDRMVERIDQLLPRDHAPTIRALAREIDTVLEGYVRGQVLVCIILGTYYAIALSAAGLRFGLIVGIISGIISFIPYLGSLTGFVISLILALLQFWPDYTQIILIMAIYQLGQIVEGNFLQPKLVGDRVQLHPVWVMFALFAFGALFGFVGALLAVPVAAAIGVVARYSVARYQTSPLYLGDRAYSTGSGDMVAQAQHAEGRPVPPGVAPTKETPEG